jgi:hypothetical protein
VADGEAPAGEEELLRQIQHLDVRQFVATAASTLASLAYAKLEGGDLPQARIAIDGMAALAPLLEGDAQRDLTRALTGLQVAYAGALLS